MHFNMTYIMSGFVVGGLVGLTGVGGGSLMTPLLTLIFGVSPGVAVGTDLAFAAITKLFGTAIHRKVGTIKWELAFRLLKGALPAAVVGSLVIYFYGNHMQDMQVFFKIATSTALFLTAFAMFFRESIKVIMQNRRGKFIPESRKYAITVLAGALVGFLVTFSSIGAGAIGAVVLITIYPYLTSSEIAGTDIAYATPVTIIGALGHASAGNIDSHILMSLLIGSLPGIYMGSMGTRLLPEKFLRTCLSITIFSVATKMAFY